MWEKKGDFFKRIEYSPPVKLAAIQSYINQQVEAIVVEVCICGYVDGSFVLRIHPASEVSFSFIEEGFRHTTFINSTVEISKSYCDNGIVIKINSAEDLRQSLGIIGGLDNFSQEIQSEIETAYRWLQDKNKSHFPKDIITTPAKQPPQVTKDVDKDLIEAVNSQNLQAVKEALVRRANPDVICEVGNTALRTTFWNYIAEDSDKRACYGIIKYLLRYGADPTIKAPFNHQTILTSAIRWEIDEIVELVLNHTKVREIRVAPSLQVDPNLTMRKLMEHFDRIDACQQRRVTSTDVKSSKLKLKRNSIDGENEVVTTFKRKEGGEIESTLTRTNKLTDQEIEALFQLFKNDFRLADTSETDEHTYFLQKLGLRGNIRQVYIDLIKDKEKIIGFNCFEFYKDTFEEKPRIIVYCNLACMDLDYRGTRVMTYFSFRPPYILKRKYPETEITVFFNAIHYNSYRQIYDIPHFPKYHSLYTCNYIVGALETVYGRSRASQFDGKAHVFLATNLQVKGGAPDPKKSELPGIIGFYDKLTERKGGIPVFFPVTDETKGFFSESVANRLKKTSFDEHVSWIAEHAPEFKMQTREAPSDNEEASLGMLRV